MALASRYGLSCGCIKKNGNEKGRAIARPLDQELTQGASTSVVAAESSEFGHAACSCSAAILPDLLSRTISQPIFWPSTMLVIPARSTAEMWTNTSEPPLSGWMKPKPFVELNHFTVPVVMMNPFLSNIAFSRRERTVSKIEILREEDRRPAPERK